MSTCTSANRRSGVDLWNAAVVCLLIFARWHPKQDRAHRPQSVWMLCHTNWCNLAPLQLQLTIFWSWAFGLGLGLGLLLDKIERAKILPYVPLVGVSGCYVPSLIQLGNLSQGGLTYNDKMIKILDFRDNFINFAVIFMTLNTTPSVIQPKISFA